ncbi:MAG: pyridoxamine 5'-phosphate oxidase family protein [Streptosporangiaceae bacterium]
MPSQRDRVTMTPGEVAQLLASCRKVQLATISPDGYPHLVTMYYTLAGGRIAFWTYRTSQKARNLARDPRISCLVETGEAYFDLRGALIQGVVETVTDPDGVYQIGLAVGAVVGGGRADAGPPQPDGAISAYVASAARKRYAYIVEPRRVISWDHHKLEGPSA